MNNRLIIVRLRLIPVGKVQVLNGMVSSNIRPRDCDNGRENKIRIIHKTPFVWTWADDGKTNNFLKTTKDQKSQA